VNVEAIQTSFFPGDQVKPDWLEGEKVSEKTLFPFQVKAFDGLKHSLLSGNKRVMLKAPTAFGKTILSSHIVRSAIKKRKRVIFCVDAISLIDQTVKKFWQDGIQAIGVIQAQHEMTDNDQPVQVCSVQTLRNRMIPPADLVILDEAHVWYKFYAEWMLKPEWENVPFIGLSATPYTRGLGKYFTDLIIPCTTQELIDAGYLSPFEVYGPSEPDLSSIPTVSGDYKQDSVGKVMDTPELISDAVESWLEFGENRPTLCFAVNCAHAKNLQKKFEVSGIPTAYMDAFTEIEERREIEKEIKEGRIKVVCNVGVLTKGVDWPWISCISLNRPTKSEILYQQIIGRGLRTCEGKKNCIIIDHTKSTALLGYVTHIDEKHTTLDMGKPKKASKSTPKERLPSLCPKCKFVKDVGVHECPKCGFQPETTK